MPQLLDHNPMQRLANQASFISLAEVLKYLGLEDLVPFRLMGGMLFDPK